MFHSKNHWPLAKTTILTQALRPAVSGAGPTGHSQGLSGLNLGERVKYSPAMRPVLDFLFGDFAVGTGVALFIGAGFTLLADEFKKFGAAKICFYIAVAWVYGKVLMWGFFTHESFYIRVTSVFLVFGLVGVGLVEALRLANARKASLGQSSKSEPTKTAPIELKSSGTNSPNIVGSGNIVGSTVIIHPQAPKSEPKLKSSSPSTRGIVGQLAIFINEGSEIQRRFIASNDEQAELQEANEWATRVENYLIKNLDASYGIQFRNSAGNAWMGMPANHSVVGGGYWQNIEGKKNCLNGFIGALRQRSQ